MIFNWLKKHGYPVMDIRGCEAHGDVEETYLMRAILIDSRRGRLMLHWFKRSDADREMHDHPWNFWTIMLWHGYVEHTPKGQRRLWPGMILYRPATHRHRVKLINRKPAVTLVWAGPKVRSWGFWEDGRFAPWREFFASKKCADY